MGKVLDITSRLKERKSLDTDKKVASTEILEMTEARQEIINRDRREVKRTILTEFIGAFVVLPEKGLLKVALYDVSENGMAFDLEMTEGGFNFGDEVAMRVYLNHSTYFPFTIRITNSRAFEEDGIIRHGTNFIKGTVNDVALHHFIKFIENVSASLKTDSGDILVSNIS
ncbi:MAG: PilZ domain-containing protein [Bdellovibrio sp.]